MTKSDQLTPYATGFYIDKRLMLPDETYTDAYRRLNRQMLGITEDKELEIGRFMESVITPRIRFPRDPHKHPVILRDYFEDLGVNRR